MDKDRSRLLMQKHLILCGGEERRRIGIAREVLSSFSDPKPLLFHILPGLHTFDDYLNMVRQIFPIFSPLGLPKTKMTLDQIWDMHLDWVEKDPEPKIIFWEEICLEQGEYLAEILNDYVTWAYILNEISPPDKHPWFRLLATSPVSLINLCCEAKFFIGRGEEDTRTNEDIWKQYLVIEDI